MHRSIRGLVRLICAVLLLTCLSVVTSPSTTSRASVAGAATPVVHGNTLVDSSTNTVFVPHGVNWPSFEYACWQGWGYSGDTSTAQAQAIASWKVNTVRLPLNQDCWLGLQGSPANGTIDGYRAAVRSWVDTLNAAGLVVILDLHLSAPAGHPAHGQHAMADAQSVTFWQSVAAAFRASPSVMFDLFNEPYSRWNDSTNSWAFQLTWTCWRNGGCQAPVDDDTSALSGPTYTVAGMSQLVAAVRGAGSTQPIMLGGLDYSNDLTGWLANRPNDGQLVASWHNYPGQRCHDVTCWNAEIAPVAAVVPVVTGEFGETDGGSTFLSTFMTWADAHGVGYAPWAWWQVSASESLENSRYALIADDSFAPKAPSGTTYHDHLATLDGQAPTVERIAGPDRYATSAAIAHAYSPGVGVAYVAAGTNYPDALSAAPAAAAQGGPLLLTETSVLPDVVRAELVRLRPSTIVVAGGPAVVSDDVYRELASLAPTIHRDYGDDRYATSRMVDERAFTAGTTRAYVATGNDYPDALSAAAAAGASGSPVILLDGTAQALDAPTSALLSELGANSAVIVGGPQVVSPQLESGLQVRFGPTNIMRLAGMDRYGTSSAINHVSFVSSPTVYFATGTGFADALSGAALAGSSGSALYIIPPGCVPGAVLADLRTLGTTHLVLLGGPGVLGAGVEELVRC